MYFGECLICFFIYFYCCSRHDWLFSPVWRPRRLYASSHAHWKGNEANLERTEGYKRIGNRALKRGFHSRKISWLYRRRPVHSPCIITTMLVSSGQRCVFFLSISGSGVTPTLSISPCFAYPPSFYPVILLWYTMHNPKNRTFSLVWIAKVKRWLAGIVLHQRWNRRT